MFTYDGKGNRLEVNRNGTVTRYIYDAAGNLLAEADENNVITRYYIYGAGLLAMVTPANQVYNYHFNAIGSAIAITDQSGTMVNKYSYTPFGVIANQTEAFFQPFKFVGQFGVMAEPGGFYYMRARYYDPSVGRFISEDPIGFASGEVNFYVYAANNPILFVDPWGLTKDGRPERILPGYPGLWDIPYNWVKDNPGKAIDLVKITAKHATDFLIGKIVGPFIGYLDLPPRDAEANPLRPDVLGNGGCK